MNNNTAKNALKIFAGLAFGVFILAIAGCAPKYTAADPSIAPENRVTLNLDHNLGIVKFDGKDAEWNAWGFGVFPSSETSVIIAPGRHRFLIDFQGWDDGKYFEGQNIAFSYDNFGAGKTYKLKYRRDGLNINVFVEEN